MTIGRKTFSRALLEPGSRLVGFYRCIMGEIDTATSSPVRNTQPTVDCYAISFNVHNDKTFILESLPATFPAFTLPIVTFYAIDLIN